MFIDPNEPGKIEQEERKKRPHLNLKIDKIFINGVEQAEGILQANQAVFVVSQKVDLKSNQIGLLSSKNKFDEKGLLTICSKTVHPGYKGRISAQFINIHQDPIAVRNGDSFLELMVYENKEEFDKFPEGLKKSDKEYLQKIKDRSQRYPDFFLNIKGVKKEILQEVNQIHGWGFIKSFSITLGIISVLIAIGTVGFSYWVTSNTFQRADKIIGYINDYSSVESVEEIQAIKLKLKTIEDELKAAKMKNTSS